MKNQKYLKEGDLVKIINTAFPYSTLKDRILKIIDFDKRSTYYLVTFIDKDITWNDVDKSWYNKNRWLPCDYVSKIEHSNELANIINI